MQHATTLAADGHTTEAAHALHRVLLAVPADGWVPDQQLVDVVALYLACIPEQDTDGHPYLLSWARYALHTNQALHGPTSLGTIDAAYALLWVLCMSCDEDTWPLERVSEILITWLTVVQAHTVRHGRHARVTITARLHRAEMLHRVGQCAPAAHILKRLWSQWEALYGTTDTTILLTLARVLLDCGAHDDATAWVLVQIRRLPVPARAALHQALTNSRVSRPAAVHRTVCTYPTSGPLQERIDHDEGVPLVEPHTTPATNEATE